MPRTPSPVARRLQDTPQSRDVATDHDGDVVDAQPFTGVVTRALGVAPHRTPMRGTPPDGLTVDCRRCGSPPKVYDWSSRQHAVREFRVARVPGSDGPGSIE